MSFEDKNPIQIDNKVLVQISHVPGLCCYLLSLLVTGDTEKNQISNNLWYYQMNSRYENILREIFIAMPISDYMILNHTFNCNMIATKENLSRHKQLRYSFYNIIIIIFFNPLYKNVQICSIHRTLSEVVHTSFHGNATQNSMYQ